ncbi:Retrovirus-related Pol polyprotein, partial [Mucuna pruriens]
MKHPIEDHSLFGINIIVELVEDYMQLGTSLVEISNFVETTHVLDTSNSMMNVRPIGQQQRRLNTTILDVDKKEVMKLLAAGIIYPILDNQWVSPVQVVPKKSKMTVIKNQNDELLLTRIQHYWRVCIDYRKLNQATRKDHFPLPFIDQVLERLLDKSHYCFLDGFSG